MLAKCPCRKLLQLTHNFAERGYGCKFSGIEILPGFRLLGGPPSPLPVDSACGWGTLIYLILLFVFEE